jgi:soluble lytic murein transglycosylase-like protein
MVKILIFTFAILTLSACSHTPYVNQSPVVSENIDLTTTINQKVAKLDKIVPNKPASLKTDVVSLSSTNSKTPKSELESDEVNEAMRKWKERHLAVEREREQLKKAAEKRKLEIARKAEKRKQIVVARKAEKRKQILVARKAEKRKQILVARKAKKRKQVIAARKAKKRKQVIAARKAKKRKQVIAARKAKKRKQVIAARKAKKRKQVIAARKAKKRKQVIAARKAKKRKQVIAARKAKKRKQIVAARKAKKRKQIIAARKAKKRKLTLARKKKLRKKRYKIAKSRSNKYYKVNGLYGKQIARAARRTGVDPRLLRSVIKAESNFNAKARSSAGAVGLMQLMPATARRFGVKNRRHAGSNIMGGARYLRYLLKKYRGNKRLAMAAYNAGEGRVRRNGGKVPSYTKRYVNKVLRGYNRSSKKKRKSRRRKSRR